MIMIITTAVIIIFFQLIPCVTAAFPERNKNQVYSFGECGCNTAYWADRFSASIKQDHAVLTE